ncbi:MAG: type II toxin-antitoxin system RelE/ParE family toxin [Verrucomicrobia bacterium]|nr:type II toxin-antitoxin system RelE/ParE family toxin [Verrucomicrobiota bacterium]
MKWLLLVRPEAEHDIAAARDWYDAVHPKLGDAFLDEIAVTVYPLTEHPEVPRLYYQNFRRILLQRFPYKVFYQVIGQRVVIFRVLHVRQCHESALSTPR